MGNNLGGKAGKLAILRKNKFNVPRFIVLESPNQSISLSIFKTDKIIVRSSADLEDSENASFAGIFHSEIAEKSHRDLNRAIKKVISFSKSEKVKSYLKEKNITKTPRLKLIVQEYIEGDISGVLFTTIKKSNRLGTLINFSRGTAEKVVQGEKSEELFLENGRILRSQKIAERYLKELIIQSKKIEKIFGSPQDIEWTFKNSKLYILQSRPITQKNLTEEIKIWDNSNIVESYNGVVLPLTSSFAKRVYKIAYTNLLKTVRLPKKQIELNEEVLDNLLGFFYGRFYYNILNWYRMANLFPGYDSSRKNLNAMISAKNQEDLEEEFKQEKSLLFKIKYYGIILALYPFFNYRIKNFKTYVKKQFKEFTKLNLKKKTNRELINIYNSLERNLLKKWSITLENDFLLMTAYGKLRDFSEKKEIPENEIISFISNIKNVESANQVNSLKSLSNLFWENQKLVKLAQGKKYSECLHEINRNINYLNLKSGLNSYFLKYGGRFANELKLEEDDFDEKPRYLLELLLLYKNQEKIKIEREKLSKISLPFFKKMYFELMIKKVKEYARLREELRLFRSRAFGMVRKIFNEIGKNFQLQGVIEDQKDIFYLEIQEIKNYIQGTTTIQNLKKVVSLRKEEYLFYDSKELPELFTTFGNPYLSLPLRKKENKNRLSGKGCSPGIVKGKIKILKKFSIPKRGGYEIIVAKNTDPGWTPLFGLCSGIIIEQGGILSHAAIVSRELGLPCVIAVKEALSKFKDGEIVTINGSTGEIKKHGKKKNN